MAQQQQTLPPSLLENRQPTILAVCGLFLALEFIAVLTRALSKIICKLKWGFDDVFIIAGYIFNLGVIVLVILFVTLGGTGLHVVYVGTTDPSKLLVFVKLVMTIPFVYLAAVVLPRLAIVHLYLSIFVQRLFRRICWVVVAIMLSNWVATTTVAAVQCVPFDRLWSPIPTGYCLSYDSFHQWASFANIFTDILLILLPIPYIWQIHSSVSTRIGILITFLLGGVGLLTSIVRFVDFSQIHEDIDDDPTWKTTDLLIWTVVEPGMYLFAACLPTCRPLLGFFSTKISGKSGSTSRANNSKNNSLRCSSQGTNRVGQEQAEEDSLRLQDITPNQTVYNEPDKSYDIEIRSGMDILVEHTTSIEYEG